MTEKVLLVTAEFDEELNIFQAQSLVEDLAAFPYPHTYQVDPEGRHVYLNVPLEGHRDGAEKGAYLYELLGRIGGVSIETHQHV